MKKWVLFSILFSICFFSACSFGIIQSSIDGLQDSLRDAYVDFLAQSTVTLPVLASPLPTETPVPTGTPEPTRTPRATRTPHIDTFFPTPTWQEIDLSTLPQTKEDKFEVVKDVTFPDNSVLSPGEIFVKSFRLKNTGVSAWKDGMLLSIKSSGEMNTPSITKAFFTKPMDLIELVAGSWGMRVYSVEPGETADLAVILIAPNEPGSYQIDFQLIKPDGTMIYTPFWMRFRVEAEDPTETPEPTDLKKTPTPTPLPFDWNGQWAMRNPYLETGMEAISAWLTDDGDMVKGFFYKENGEPVLIRGSLSEKGSVLKGDYTVPWQKYSTSFIWKMSDSRDQFSAVTEDGELGIGVSCGAREKAAFPNSCAVTQ